eukprot:GHVO01028875.1.p1 GENE.GHVO01028875.1~~GHVO01028875.1.p1  ORF type:complete len:185 (+),score=7.69 GHVO01028875.1:50-556(+)
MSDRFILAALAANGRVRTKLDLTAAYYSVAIRETDKWILGISHNDIHYQYQVLPMGINPAPGLFHRAIEKLLDERKMTDIVHYIDDFVVTGETRSVQLRTQQLIEVLRRYGFKLNMQKSLLHDSIVFLGYSVSQKSVRRTRSRQWNASCSWKSTATTIPSRKQKLWGT